MNSRFADLSFVATWIAALWLMLTPSTATGQATDQTTASPTPLATPESVARNWGLTPAEYARSQQLLSLHRGLIHEQITPIEALGIFSTTEEDRRRYATLYAQKQMMVLNRISDFEADYLEAMRELNPTTTHTDSERHQLVIDASCASADCRTLIRRALSVAASTGLDIHLTGTGAQDAVVRRWAAINDIPPDSVRNRTITLNHAALGMKQGLFR